MDKISKVLGKLTEKERETIKDTLAKVKDNTLEGLNIKKLRGRDDIYRIRKGNLRIVYQKKGEATLILLIERRSTNTYKNI